MNICKELFVLLFYITITNCYSQTGTAATSGIAESENGSYTFTIGESYMLVALGENQETESGVQHGYEITTHSKNYNSAILVDAKLYPNPTTDYLYLDIKGSDLKGLSYRVLDLTGRMLLDAPIYSENSEINFTTFEDAVYLFQVVKENQTLTGFKVIKR